MNPSFFSSQKAVSFLRRRRGEMGFSLVEVTLALGIVSFSVLTLVGMIPLGLTTFHKAVAASVGSQNASGYQLATGRPVMAVGGFNGTDPSPTLAQFQQWVAQGDIHYFIGGGGMGGFGRGGNSGGSNTSSQIAQWVAQNYTARTVGTTTVYDLTTPAGSTTA